MTAKEERAMHLEIHRMNRTQGDTIARNAALESECARLRMALKHESENHAATRDAATQRHNTYHAAENERVETMQRERQKMQETIKQMEHETIAQIKDNNDELIGMKRKLYAQYAEFIDKKSKELDGARREFEEECERRLVTENKERVQREQECERRLASENKERVQRDHDHRSHIASHMEAANKMTAEKMRQLEEAKKHFEEECERRSATENKERVQRERDHRSHIASHMEEANKMTAAKMQQLEEAKKHFEEECERRLAAENKERVQREHDHRAKFMTHMEEANKMTAAKMLQLEEAKKHFDEECERRLAAENAERVQREHDHRSHIAAHMEEVTKMKAAKMQQLEEAKKHFEEECERRLAAENAERVQREHDHRSHIASHMESANKMTAEKMRQLEEAKKHFEEECERRLAAENAERVQREHDHRTQFMTHMEEATKMTVEKMRQLEEERTQIARREQEIAKLKENMKRDLESLMQQINENKLQLVREKTELIAFTEKRFEEYVQSYTSELMKTVSFTQMSHAVAANYAHTQLIHNLGFKDKRILIYSHYSKHDEVESYNYLTLEGLDHRFDFIIVLTNCPNKWELNHPNYNKFHILSYNFKSDFRNYGVFIMQTEQTLMHASQVCLMNDSFVVVDVGAFGRCMKHLFESTAADFAGITSSYEGTYHLQSYFMVFNGRAVTAIVDYFKMRGLPMNHHASISDYELGITSHLVKNGLVPFALVSNQDMPVPMNTTHCKWSAVLQHTGIVKRQHFLKQYPTQFAMTDLNIALIADKFSHNLHFIHFLRYNGIKLD